MQLYLLLWVFQSLLELNLLLDSPPSPKPNDATGSVFDEELVASVPTKLEPNTFLSVILGFFCFGGDILKLCISGWSSIYHASPSVLELQLCINSVEQQPSIFC